MLQTGWGKFIFLVGLSAMAAGCVVLTNSHQPSRDVLITVTEVDSGKAVAGVPIRVHYWMAGPSHIPCLVVHDFGRPDDVCGRTDNNGQVLVAMAEYPNDILLTVGVNR